VEKSQFEASQSQYFDSQAERANYLSNDETRAAEFEFSSILSFLALPQGANILELGCGLGRNSLKFLARGYDVFGVDISKKSLEKLQKKYQQKKTSQWGKLVLGTKIPKNKNFDACLCVNILHHLENIKKDLLEIKNSLSKNGIIFVFEPNPLYFPWYLFFLTQGILSVEKGILKSNLWNLKKILQEVGFQKIKIQPYGFFPTRLLSRWPFLLKLTAVDLVKIPPLSFFSFHNMIKARK
jgi:2-polyprenyl-3-methyl-5-hydroxy-6-metoxy-1,4-benzoquinol methylase